VLLISNKYPVFFYKQKDKVTYMYFEWWMIAVLGLVWIVSMILYGRTSFEQGCVSTIDVLRSNGYIRIDGDGEVVGLCNQDQDRFDSSD